MKSGDPCPKCSNRLRVRTSRPAASYQEQRLECVQCGHQAVVYVPRETVKLRAYNN